MRSHIMHTCVNVHIVPTCVRLSSTVCWNKNAAAQTARASQQSLHAFFIEMKWLFKPHENGGTGVTGQC